MIIEKTIEKITEKLDESKVTPPKVSKVVIGLGYTGVELNFSGVPPQLGVAFTLPELLQNKACSKINYAGKLTEKKAQELLNWAKNEPSLEKVIGIATLNAFSQYILQSKTSEYKFLNKDLRKYLGLNNHTRVTFIGLIEPMIRQFSKITKNILIIEKNLEFSQFFENFKLLRSIDKISQDDLDTDILICTGTSIINDTLEKIIDTFRNKASFIALIGPTASMIPDIFFEYGIDLIGGMKFKNSEASFRVLQEAGGTKFFKKYAIKYNLVSD
ncbi:MAG: Rossmann-like domain-containing protein [Promethearchaeati archaeon]